MLAVLFLSAMLVLTYSEVPSANGAGYVNPIPPGVVVPAPTTFHTYDSLVAELLQLNSSRPDVVSIQTIGTTYENRSIMALRLTLPGSEPKKNILYMGLHHADEWQSMEVVMYLIHYYLANSQDLPMVRAILQNANVWFIPLVNPDGLTYSQIHDSLWRKNRKDNGDGTFGVDLNRNYGYEWKTGGFANDGSLVNSQSVEYPGPASFSELETQAIRDFALTNPPVFSISYHTAGEWILFPWSYTPSSTTDDGVFRAYSQEMAAFNGYKILQEGHSNHNKPGNADDWLYHQFGTLAFTYEVGPGFSSQDEQRIESIVQSNVQSALYGASLSLHLTPLSCAPRLLLCVPSLSIVSLAVPGLAGAVFFGVRMQRRRANRLNRDDPDGENHDVDSVDVGPTLRPTIESLTSRCPTLRFPGL
jgi:hypothetical protein